MTLYCKFTIYRYSIIILSLFYDIASLVFPKSCYYVVMAFREQLREQIEYCGLLDKEVAARAGITKRAIDSYVGSEACMPSAEVAVRLAKVLGVSVEYLVTGSEGKNHEMNPNDNAAKLMKHFARLSARHPSPCWSHLRRT